MNACRFQTTFLGSRAIVGDLLESGLLDSEDSNGVSVREALGLTAKTQATLSRLAYKPEQVKGCASICLSAFQLDLFIHT